MRKPILAGLVLSLAVLLGGCQSAYYAAWEKVGVEKRDILVDRVEDAQESQEEAQEQFRSALEAFGAVVNFDGGELETVYHQMNDQFEASQAAATDVSNRIEKISAVAEALFDEWEEELGQYTNDKLKRSSEQTLRETRRRYDSMLRAMQRVERSMAPVLATLQDNVLFLKHNLNATAIGSLQGELNSIQSDVDGLIKEMQAAIQQSNEFLASIKS